MAPPPVFSPYSFRAALELTVANGKLLIVDVMAQWCGPCKEMDRTTWRDDAVAAWVKEHAIAIQVDADAERDVASTLQVNAFPTVVALRAGKALSRATGFRTAEALLDWLEFVRTGETTAQRLLRTVDREKDIHGRMKLAMALLVEERWTEATDECLWLWENAAKVDPTMVTRRTFLLRDPIAFLLSAHAPARPRFQELRDRTGAAADAATDGAARRDWAVLNHCLAEPKVTFDWFQSAKTDKAAEPALVACAELIVPMLVERGLWDEILLIFRDPPAELARAWSQVSPESGALESESKAGELHERKLRVFRARAALLYGALVAARRDADAAKLREAALALDGADETRVALQKAANTAKWS